jgi:Domain of unknown function (DUF6456)
MKKPKNLTILSRHAERLLAALGSEGSYTVADPTQPDTFFVRTEQRGVSVGGGRFTSEAVDELARHDLIARMKSRNDRRRFRISEPGRAYLRRRAADEDSAFQAQHQDRVEADAEIGGERVSVTVDATESPLDWLRRRRDRHGAPLVDEACYQAGERLRRDLTLAAMLPSVTSRWEPVPSPTGPRAPDPAAASDGMIAARQRVTAALRVVGADLADLLIDVCGFLKGLEQVERERGWPPRSGKIILTLALARLADHDGIERTAKGPAQSRGIRAWRAVVLDGG